jgi:hypothetical protein
MDSQKTLNNVAKLKYMRTIVTDQNYSNKKNKGQIKFRILAFSSPREPKD